LPVYFYRIRQVDFDGKYTYSKIVRINRDAQVKNTITVLNNPVQGELAIAVNARRAVTGMVSVSDASGKMVYQRKVKVVAGNNVLDLGNFNFAGGMYYLVFTDESGNREVVQFIKK
jgi:hypothetical protein